MSFIIAIIILSILKLTFTIGRFIAAKRLKLPVEKFVIGIEWGKPIFAKKFCLGDAKTQTSQSNEAETSENCNDLELVIYPIFWGGFIEFNKDFDPETKCTNKQKNFLTFSSLMTMFLSILIIGLVYINFIPSGKYETVITSAPEHSLLKVGDKVLSANGTNTTGTKTLHSIVKSGNDLVDKIIPDSKDAAQQVIIKVERDNSPTILKVDSLDGIEYKVNPIYTPRNEVLKNIKKNFTFKFEKKSFIKNLISILAMLALISILVLVHELGHFLAAKMFKIKVERFGFGLPFGPILWQKQCGETLVVVHAFLLGGYVSFPDDDKDNTLPKDSPDRFANKPIYQRLVVVSAGVFANILAAIFLVFLTALLWGKLPTENYATIIQELSPKDNIAISTSGLKQGDKIIEINGSEINSPYAFQLYCLLSRKFDGKVSTDKVKETLSRLEKLNPQFTNLEYIPEGKVIKLVKPQPEGAIQLTEDMLRGFEKITDNKLALNDSQKALRNTISGEKTLKSDGTITLLDVAFALSDNASPLNMKVERDGKLIELAPIYSNEKGVIGVKLDKQRIFTETKDLKTSFTGGCDYLYNQTKMLLKGLWQLIAGKVPLENMHGVVAVVKYGGDVIQQDGFFQGLLLTALISLDLAIVNFLPIPALDGGHVMFLFIEKLYGKPLDEEMVNSIATAGFMFLILLMVIVLYNDIVALVLHKI